MKTSKLFPLLLSVMAIACASNDFHCRTEKSLFTSPVSLEIGLGETVCSSVNDHGIKFRKVIEDSRCPINARCITAGTVTTELMITDGSKPVSTFTLGTKTPNAEVTVNGKVFRVVFVDVTPRPQAGIQSDEKDYKIALEVIPL